MGQDTFEQAMDLWVRPEIEGRRKRGVLPSDFDLWAAQVIFPSPHDASRNSTRLNEEVRAELRYRANEPTNEGDRIPIMVDRIEAVRLPNGEDVNAAHLTMVRSESQWYMGFDFTYNRERAMTHLKAAEEFLQVSRYCREHELYRARAENLFAAAELAAEAELIMLPRGKTTKHIERAKRLHSWVELGNAPTGSDFTLYALAELRGRARYLEGPFDPSTVQLDEHEKAVEDLIVHVKTRLENAKKTPETSRHEGDHT